MATKREPPKSKLSGFNMKGYLGKKDSAQEDDQTEFDKTPAEKEESEIKPQPKETTEPEPPAEIKTPERKTPEKKNIASSEEKIAFMNYLPVELHDEFSLVFLKAKQELRGRTKKALSQTELVEAVLRYAVEGWQDKKEDILNIAEQIISNRRTKE